MTPGQNLLSALCFVGCLAVAVVLFVVYLHWEHQRELDEECAKYGHEDNGGRFRYCARCYRNLQGRD